MLKEKKERVVEELTERLRTAETLIVADYRGLTMPELDRVRAELIPLGATFTVCKNTLTRRAAAAAGVDALDDLLTGPTAIAFVTAGDMVGVAKVLSDTARTTRRLSVKGAVLSGKAVDADAVSELATLPPVDVLRGQVLGAIVAPLTSLLGLVSAPLQDLVGLIDARVDQLNEQGGGAGQPASEPPAASGEGGDSEPAEDPATEDADGAAADGEASEGGATEDSPVEAAADVIDDNEADGGEAAAAGEAEGDE